jgi:hypothetical protein
MSNKLDNFPVSSKGDRRRRYNWDEWRDGGVHELVNPDDFEVPVESMRAMVYRYASNAGLSVRTAKTRAGLAIQFINDEPEKLVDIEW